MSTNTKMKSCTVDELNHLKKLVHQLKCTLHEEITADVHFHCLHCNACMIAKSIKLFTQNSIVYRANLIYHILNEMKEFLYNEEANTHSREDATSIIRNLADNIQTNLKELSKAHEVRLSFPCKGCQENKGTNQIVVIHKSSLCNYNPVHMEDKDIDDLVTSFYGATV